MRYARLVWCHCNNIPHRPPLFFSFFLFVPVGESHWIFTHMINIFMMMKLIGPLTLAFSSWLVMWLGLIGSLLT